MTDPQTPILETKRLILRRLTLDDLDALYALYRDAEVRRFFPEGTLTYGETQEELEWIIDVYYGKYGYGLWATILKQTGAMIGRVAFWTIEGRQEVEIAYLLAKADRGQGLGTEVAQAIRDFGFAQLQLARLICLIDPDNQPSIRVAQKIGMTFEKIVELPDDDHAPMYSMSKPMEVSA